MAFDIRQGLEARDAVIGIYDPCPVVLYESTHASLYNFRYVIEISERVGAAWVEVATIKRFKNNANVGVFDVGQVLRGNLELREPSGDAIDLSDNPSSNTGTDKPYRFRVGYESSATEDGSVTTTFDSTLYVWAVAARFYDEFTSWNTNVKADYVMDGAGDWLTRRETTDVVFGGSTLSDCVVIDVDEDDNLTTSFLAATGDSPYNAPSVQIRVRWGTASSVLATNYQTLTFQDVDLDAYPGQNVEGTLVRDMHVGPRDLVTHTWATNSGTSGWDYIVWDLREVGNTGNILCKPLVLRKRPCLHKGVKFKFLNNLGGYDFLYCDGHTQKTTEFTRETHNSSTANWYNADGVANDTNLLPNDPSKRATKSEVTSVRKKYIAHTGYIDPAHNDLVHALLESKRVLATQFVKPRTNTGNEYYPVNITNSSMRAMFREVDKLIEYRIEFEYSNPQRVQV